MTNLVAFLSFVLVTNWFTYSTVTVQSCNTPNCVLTHVHSSITKIKEVGEVSTNYIANFEGYTNQFVLKSVEAYVIKREREEVTPNVNSLFIGTITLTTNLIHSKDMDTFWQ